MKQILYPFTAALVTGFFAGLAVGVWVWALHAGDPLRVGGLVGAIAAFIAWLLFRAKVEHVEATLRGYRESPLPATPAHSESIRVELSTLEGHQVDYLDLHITGEQLHKLACGLNDGIPFAQASWVGNRRPFTRPEFEAVRAELIKRNLLEWRNPGSPGQGAALTHAGRAVMRYLANTTPQR